MPAPTVAFELYDAIYHYLNQLGHSDELLQKRIRVRSRRDFMLNGRVPLTLYEQAFLAAEDITGDAAIGMRIGGAVLPSSIGVFYFLSTAGESISQILQAINKYFPLAFDFIQLDMSCDEEHFRIALHYVHNRRPNRHVVEHLMAHWYCVANRLAFDATNVPRTLYLQNPQAADAQLITDIFGTTPVLFEQPLDGFDLKLENLDFHVGKANQRLFSMSEKRADNLLMRLRAHDRIAKEISTHVMEMLESGSPGIEDVAKRMNCSGRTLQRRLAERNLNYQMLLDNIRKDMAIELLSTTALPITQIALRTGFADDSTFHRAFKRWTGASPGAYRN
ncbi:MAG: helix-turn-helix domain-containing protein [Gammaproteobacteria bacterium]|nr:helix-turn-helix domain-containing protein [Gammaproteobacteria bacterium]